MYRQWYRKPCRRSSWSDNDRQVSGHDHGNRIIFKRTELPECGFIFRGDCTAVMAEKGPPIITHLGGQHFHFEAGGIGSYQTLGEGRCPTFSRQTTRRRCLHAYGFSPELNLQPVYRAFPYQWPTKQPDCLKLERSGLPHFLQRLLWQRIPSCARGRRSSIQSALLLLFGARRRGEARNRIGAVDSSV
jgi:hypothetical protein